MALNMVIAERIRSLRGSISQEECSRRAGMKKSAWCRMERDGVKTIAALEKAALALGSEAWELLKGENNGRRRTDGASGEAGGAGQAHRDDQESIAPDPERLAKARAALKEDLDKIESFKDSRSLDDPTLW